jgi:hypothetical protein
MTRVVWEVVKRCNFRARELSEGDYVGVKTCLELPIGGEVGLVCEPFTSTNPFTTHPPTSYTHLHRTYNFARPLPV